MSGRPALIDYSTELDSCHLAKELYTVQTEMLISSRDFTGLEFADLGQSGSLAFYGTDTKKITINNDKRIRQPLTQTLSHEMTHAIDDLYGIGVERNLEILIRSSDMDVSKLRPHVSNALREDMVGEYNRQAHSTSRFTQETGAYIFEGIFKDMTEGKFEDILARYKAVTEVVGGRRGDTEETRREKEIAQEIVAVAIGSISGAMTRHIELSRGAGLSPERASFLEKLATLNAVVQPAYERANKKLSEMDRGGSAVGIVDPRRRRQMIEDGIESRILARESELHKSLADRMRAGLTRAERVARESGGNVKYGDLKRTMSPIRARSTGHIANSRSR